MTTYKTLLIIAVLIFIAICTILFFYKYNQLNANNIVKTPKGTPILTAYKSGGFVGMVYRVEIYNDKTYRFFDHDKVKESGTIDNKTNESVNYLIQKFPQLNEKYCETEGYDLIHYSLQIGDKQISLGSFDTQENCLPQDIEDNFNQIDKLMQWEPTV